mmetsp:Transcript_54928/g.160281  ORF Transcript_54928/g.160281 Transcript_54928/m.160281 type:complete len:228 (+) Transcript_54928:2069-2752(+)
MIPNKDDLLCAHHDRDEALGLCGLGRLVAEDLLESEVCKPGVPGADAGGANDVCRLQELSLCGILELLELLLIAVRELPQLLLQGEELLQLLVVRRVQVPDLVVKRQEVNAAGNCLTALGAQSHDLESGLVQLFRQLVHCDVGGRADQHLALVLPREVVNYGGARHRLACPRWALDQAERILQRLAHGVNLGVVQLRQIGSREVPRERCADCLRLHVVAQQLVVEVA